MINLKSETTNLVLEKLGENALQRLNTFTQWQDGWSGPESLAIKQATLDNLYLFLISYQSYSQRILSLFLTPEGNLSIEWRDSEHGTIVWECAPTCISLWRESMGCDNSITATNEEELATLWHNIK